MRILVIEDEKKVARFIKRGLEEAGYLVVGAADGEEGLYLAEIDDYDLIILDLVLPRKSGLEVCRELRGQSIKVPILILSARDSVEDKVTGLDMGADDYLTKPFAFAELLDRVRTLLRRRRPVHTPERLAVADLEVDLLSRRVVRAGKRIDLTAKEFALLELLMRRCGEVLPRSLIASQVWDMNFDSDTNVIDVAVRRLRAKIDDGFDAKLIQTIRGMGYVLRAHDE